MKLSRVMVAVRTDDENGGEKEEFYYLLHWGLAYHIVELSDGSFPVNYTVAICQHSKTGIVQEFLPGSLRILGIENQIK